jgi:hypothetical protein
MAYCSSYSVFTEEELGRFWAAKRYQHILRFTYNLALPKRVTRGQMIEKFGFDANAYWGFMPLSHEQLASVLAAGELDESLVIN